MNKSVQINDSHLYGIIAAVAACVIIFVYLNLDSYTEYVPIGSYFDGARIVIPEDVAVKTENIEIPSDYVPRDVKSIGRDVDDQRERSKKDWKENKMSTTDIEKSVKDYEKRLFQEAGGEAQRKKIQQEMEDRKKNQKENGSQNPKETTSSNGGNKSYSGDVMVEWDLRAAHQNNSWHVRNPGYTCGYGSSGKVIVRVKVNQNGDVTEAKYDPVASVGANTCMIEQAVKYARMSRFIYSASAPKLQEGWISYTFRSQ